MGAGDFLQVTAFLGTELDARAIRSAIDLGIIDALGGDPGASFAELSQGGAINPRGLRLLLDLLEANGVVGQSGERIVLTAEFRAALPFRDLLLARIDFADLVADDLRHLFTPLLTDLPQFMSRSKVFELFRYDRCLEVTPENLAATGAWTRFTTCLTKYEAGAALDALDLASVERAVDLGGNTGEFALRMCRRNPRLQATVVDLPVVCELGRQHLAATASPDEMTRIAFHPTDMRRGKLPDPADLVAFKSVLHDWPDDDAAYLLERAGEIVRPGGLLLIFERAPIALGGHRLRYGLLPELAFLHFLRPADFYLEKLGDLGFEAIEHRTIPLDIAFHLITARRPL